jgi:hypothetical protein
VALILNSSGFTVFIQCENSQGREIGWNGDEIDPGITRYIQAERIEGNGGTCNCHIYAADYSPSESASGYVIGASITSHEIGPHDLQYFNGGAFTTDPTGLRYTDTSKRQGW